MFLNIIETSNRPRKIFSERHFRTQPTLYGIDIQFRGNMEEVSPFTKR